LRKVLNQAKQGFLKPFRAPVDKIMANEYHSREGSERALEDQIGQGR